jgi:hypothetical protein
MHTYKKDASLFALLVHTTHRILCRHVSLVCTARHREFSVLRGNPCVSTGISLFVLAPSHKRNCCGCKIGKKKETGIQFLRSNS